jgi:hypothetical protein
MSEQAKSDAKVQKPSTYYDEPHEVVVDSSLWRWPSTGRSLLVMWMPPFTPPLAKKKTATSARKTRKRQDILVHQGAAPHRQTPPIRPLAPATLAYPDKLIDGKVGDSFRRPQTS